MTQREGTCTVLGTSTRFSGKIQYRSSMIVRGFYEGRIVAEGALSIEATAEVKADVTAQSLLVSGLLTGSVTVSQQVEITATGRIFGDISVVSLHVEKGAVLKGRVSMLRDPDSLDIFSVPPEQLKRDLKELQLGQA